jgi:hypothetical protein
VCVYRSHVHTYVYTCVRVHAGISSKKKSSQ